MISFTAKPCSKSASSSSKFTRGALKVKAQWGNLPKRTLDFEPSEAAERGTITTEDGSTQMYQQEGPAAVDSQPQPTPVGTQIAVLVVLLGIGTLGFKVFSPADDGMKGVQTLAYYSQKFQQETGDIPAIELKKFNIGPVADYDETIQLEREAPKPAPKPKVAEVAPEAPAADEIPISE